MFKMFILKSIYNNMNMLRYYIAKKKNLFRLAIMAEIIKPRIKINNIYNILVSFCINNKAKNAKKNPNKIVIYIWNYLI
jgi:hypothetical protein